MRINFNSFFSSSPVVIFCIIRVFKETILYSSIVESNEQNLRELEFIHLEPILFLIIKEKRKSSPYIEVCLVEHPPNQAIFHP